MLTGEVIINQRPLNRATGLSLSGSNPSSFINCTDPSLTSQSPNTTAEDRDRWT